MIGFLEKPTGRMGNVLIQYAFLRQLAERIGTDYFHVEMPYKEYFEEFGEKNLSWRVKFSKKWMVTNAEILSLGIEKFLKECREREQKGYNIVLQPPVLGHLFEFKDENPGKYFRIKKEYIEKWEVKNQILVGIHFRGTDFKEWNEVASLPFSYYKDAIDLILKDEEGKSIGFVLFTDDEQFDPFQKTCDYLCRIDFDGEILYGDMSKPMIYDLYKLSNCDYIISSPSTYAIVAGIMGKKDKKIIHAKQWINHCVEKGESFWIDVSKNAVPYYVILDIL